MFHTLFFYFSFWSSSNLLIIRKSFFFFGKIEMFKNKLFQHDWIIRRDSISEILMNDTSRCLENTWIRPWSVVISDCDGLSLQPTYEPMDDRLIGLEENSRVPRTPDTDPRSRDTSGGDWNAETRTEDCLPPGFIYILDEHDINSSV